MTAQPAPSSFDSLSQACAQARGGYAWWYVEAHDVDEGRFGLTLIVFAGSVFSPHYAAQLAHGRAATGLQHPAVHCALYEKAPGAPCLSRQRLWVMNEYPADRLYTDATQIRVADTALRYRPGGLSIDIDEDTTRFFGRPGARLQAQLTIQTPLSAAQAPGPFVLGALPDGQTHYWQPIAPAATVQGDIACGPLRVRLRGHAYCDRNFGSGRLEDTFRRWSWAHGVTTARDPAALVLYQAERRDGSVLSMALRYPPQPPGATDEEITIPGPMVWRDESDCWGGAAGARTDFLWMHVPPRFHIGPYRADRNRRGSLEDAPFYARYAATLSTPADPALGPAGAASTYDGVGEYLDLNRFRSRAVQKLLTYKTRLVPAPLPPRAIVP